MHSMSDSLMEMLDFSHNATALLSHSSNNAVVYIVLS